MFKTSECIKNDKGFTLVELMVTVLLTAIAVVSIYRGYTAFSQSADAQQQVIEMQQNLRIGITWLAKDIRRAGMNEEGGDVAGFIAANATSVEFSMDLGSANGPVIFATDGEDNDDDGLKDAADEDESRIGDGDIDDDGERIHYLYDEDTNNNGVLDADEDVNGNGVLDQDLLQRGVWDFVKDDYIWHTLITTVEALDFVYWDDGDPGVPGAVPPVPPVLPAIIPFTVEDPPASGIFWLDTGDLAIVDRVEITLVVRATNEDYRYTNRETYRNLQDDPLVSNPGDNFRRRAFTMSVQIRNNI